MTVKHLQSLQRQQLAVAVASDPSVLHKFKNGFSECATEVSRYISNIEGVETGVKQRLAAHLTGCVTGLQQSPAISFPTGQTSTIPLTISQSTSGVSIQTGSLGDVNNNQNSRVQVPAGIQLIPSRLPTGELALLVPNSSNLPFFSNAILGNNNFAVSTEATQRNTSAFTTVKPSKPPESSRIKMSPPLSPASSTTSFEDQPDSFSKPRTPSPREVSVSFPTPPGPSIFKPTQKEYSPPQQFQVTSTSISPENKPLKIEYKSVPIYQPNEKHNQYRSNKAMEPLSVITSDRLKSVPKEAQETGLYRRKRPFPDGLLTVAEQPPALKHFRHSEEGSATITSSSGSPEGPTSIPNSKLQFSNGTTEYPQFRNASISSNFDDLQFRKSLIVPPNSESSEFCKSSASESPHFVPFQKSLSSGNQCHQFSSTSLTSGSSGSQEFNTPSTSGSQEFLQIQKPSTSVYQNIESNESMWRPW